MVMPAAFASAAPVQDESRERVPVSRYKRHRAVVVRADIQEDGLSFPAVACRDPRIYEEHENQDARQAEEEPDRVGKAGDEG